MKFYIELMDSPQNGRIEDDHYGVKYDYFFMGRAVLSGQIQNLKKQPKPRFSDLLLYMEIIDHRNRKYIRKEKCRLLRVEVKSHIEQRLKNFMRDLDISPVFIRGLLRDFDVLPAKSKTWDEFEFDRY